MNMKLSANPSGYFQPIGSIKDKNKNFDFFFPFEYDIWKKTCFFK